MKRQLGEYITKPMLEAKNALAFFDVNKEITFVVQYS